MVPMVPLLCKLSKNLPQIFPEFTIGRMGENGRMGTSLRGEWGEWENGDVLK